MANVKKLLEIRFLIFISILAYPWTCITFNWCVVVKRSLNVLIPLYFSIGNFFLSSFPPFNLFLRLQFCDFTLERIWRARQRAREEEPCLEPASLFIDQKGSTQTHTHPIINSYTSPITSHKQHTWLDSLPTCWLINSLQSK